MVHPEKGYKTISVVQLVNIFSVVIGDLPGLFDAFRVLCAWLHLKAKDEVTKRTLQKNKQFVNKTIKPIYQSRNEIRKLVGGRQGIASQLRKLEELGLLTISGKEVLLTETPLPGTRNLLELICGVDKDGNLRRSLTRPVPIPTEWLKEWAKPSRNKVVPLLHLFYCASGLSFKSKRLSKVQNAARFKFNQLLQIVPIVDSRLKRARRTLIEEGRITEDQTRYQIQLNRYGHYFQVNLQWNRNITKTPVENKNEIAPPKAENYTEMPSPIKRDLKQATLVRDQKPKPVSSGVFTKQKKPNPNNVRREDLRNVGTLEALFKVQDWIPRNQANFENFVGAAVRARDALNRADGKQNDPVRIFVSIVKNKLWYHITQAQEDEAMSRIRAYFEKNPTKPHYTEQTSTKVQDSNARIDAKVELEESFEDRLAIRKLIREGLGIEDEEIPRAISAAA